MFDIKSFPWWAQKALRAIYTRLKFQAIRIQVIDAKGEVITLCHGTGWQVAKMDLAVADSQKVVAEGSNDEVTA